MGHGRDELRVFKIRDRLFPLGRVENDPIVLVEQGNEGRPKFRAGVCWSERASLLEGPAPLCSISVHELVRERMLVNLRPETRGATQ